MNRTVTDSAGWNRIAELEKKIAELEEDREVQHLVMSSDRYLKWLEAKP